MKPEKRSDEDSQTRMNTRSPDREKLKSLKALTAYREFELL